MRNRLLVLLMLFLVALASLTSCGGGDSASGAETALTPTFQDEGNVVSATGEVRPARWANLSLPMGGTVRAVQVEEGQDVAAGQQLLEVEAVQLERAVAETQAALSAAEANLARAKADAHPQDVAAAEQAVAAAQANEAVAQAQITAAEAEQGRAEAGVTTARNQVAIAQAGVKIAQAELDLAQAGARSEVLASARAALDKVRAAVRLAQAEYDRSDRASDSPQALALEGATLDLQMAQAEYDRLVSGPRSTDLAPIRANIEAAKARVSLAEVQAAQAESQIALAEAATVQAQAALEAARAQTAQARAALDRLEAGPTAEEIAVAEAAVDQAREAHATAQAILDQATLVAPFDGTVGMLHVRQGEEVLLGQTVLTLGDLTTLRVETTDLDEIDVALIQPDQQVDLAFDALPEEVLPGRVVHIAPMSTPGQAATSYRVIVELVETDPALRWGMTAFVDIQVK
jgi:HlyD family secretion protein